MNALLTSLARLFDRAFAFFGRALGDGESPSASRIMAMLTVVCTIVLPMGLWAALSLHARALLELPGSLIGFMSAASALNLALFHLNKREEGKTTPPEVQP